jgi:hypothetical protein
MRLRPPFAATLVSTARRGSDQQLAMPGGSHLFERTHRCAVRVLHAGRHRQPARRAGAGRGHCAVLVNCRLGHEHRSGQTVPPAPSAHDVSTSSTAPTVLQVSRRWSQLPWYSPTAGCSRSLAAFRLAASTALKAAVRCSFSSVALRLVLPRECGASRRPPRRARSGRGARVVLGSRLALAFDAEAVAVE